MVIMKQVCFTEKRLVVPITSHTAMIHRFFQFLKICPLWKGGLRKHRPTIIKWIPRSLLLWLYRSPIDWKKLDIEIAHYLKGSEYGVNETKKKPKVIISVTSYPPRIPRIHYTIHSLLRQHTLPDEVVLWLAEEQFSNRDADLPPQLLQLVHHGLTIKYCRDFKSFKKLVPSLKEYPDDIIVTVDDDKIYFPDMLESLLDSYQKNDQYIHVHEAHRIFPGKDGKVGAFTSTTCGMELRQDQLTPSYRNILLGGTGCLYPPHSLHTDVTHEELFMALAPTADDIWFWAMAVLNGTKICVVDNKKYPLANEVSLYEDIVSPKGLKAINGPGGQNDVQFDKVLRHYPVLTKRIV